MIKEKLVIEAYRKAFGYADDVEIAFSDVKNYNKFLGVYQELDMLDIFDNTRPEWIPAPVNNAKHVALNAAVQIVSHYSTLITFDDKKKEPSLTVTLADEIYQWLIKKDNL